MCALTVPADNVSVLVDLFTEVTDTFSGVPISVMILKVNGVARLEKSDTWSVTKVVSPALAFSIKFPAAAVDVPHQELPALYQMLAKTGVTQPMSF